MRATFRTIEGLTSRQVVNQSLKAMNEITEADNGTLCNPHELASSVLRDGRTLIETIHQDGCVNYNDGWYIVEVNENHLYVDLTSYAIKEEFGEDVLKKCVEEENYSPYEYVGDLA